MPRTAAKFLKTLPWVAASVAFYWASDQAQLRPPDLGFHWQDKLFHTVAYAVYGLLLAIAVQAWFVDRSVMMRVGLVILIGVAFGASDEYHQTFVDGRIGSVSDAIADALGVLLAGLGFLRWIAVRERG